MPGPGRPQHPAPTKLTVNHDGKKCMVVTISDHERTDKIDDKEFTVDD